MAPRLVEYADASPRVKATYDEILAYRGFSTVPQYYKAIAIDPAMLERVWRNVRTLYDRKRIDILTKELIAIAVCSLHGADYCTKQHAVLARKLGMDDEMFGELLETISVFSETSAVCKVLGLSDEF